MVCQAVAAGDGEVKEVPVLSSNTQLDGMHGAHLLCQNGLLEDAFGSNDVV
jgi:hypothetical protein